MNTQSIKEDKSLETERWGILNPYGDLWTPNTFDTEWKAWAHLDGFLRSLKQKEVEPASFKVVRVIVTVRISYR